MSIVESLNLVMEEVGAVAKRQKNDHFKFNFRGIDAVTNAVSPALKKHGVVVYPQVLDMQVSNTASSRGAAQLHVVLTIKYIWANSDGEQIETIVVGEAADTGDKAVSKAHSVAFRTAMLQTLCLPTDETDPDADSYELQHDKRRPQKPAPKVERLPDDQFAQWVDSINKCQLDPDDPLAELKKVFAMAWKAAQHPDDQAELKEVYEAKKQELTEAAA